jgi:hypothetical protein
MRTGKSEYSNGMRKRRITHCILTPTTFSNPPSEPLSEALSEVLSASLSSLHCTSSVDLVAPDCRFDSFSRPPENVAVDVDGDFDCSWELAWMIATKSPESTVGMRE